MQSSLDLQGPLGYWRKGNLILSSHLTSEEEEILYAGQNLLVSEQLLAAKDSVSSKRFDFKHKLSGKSEQV